MDKHSTPLCLRDDTTTTSETKTKKLVREKNLRKVEPGDIFDPDEVDGNAAIIEEEASKEHERDEQRQPQAQGHLQGVGEAGDHIACTEQLEGTVREQDDNLTKGYDDLNHQFDDSEGYGKLDKLSVESYHVVHDAKEDGRGKEDYRQLGDLLGQEICVRSVHPIEMLSEKDGELHAEDIDDGEHVGKGHVGDEEEHGAVDIHDGLLLCICFTIQFLTKVDKAENQGNELKQEKSASK